VTGRTVLFERHAGLRASASFREVEMLAWVLLAANMPTVVCTICSAFLAYKERPQWVWFAGLAVLAGIGGLLTLSVVHAQQLSFAWRA
jgi:hypothetical protein